MNKNIFYFGNNQNPVPARLDDIQQRTNDIRDLQASLHDEQVMADEQVMERARLGRLDPNMLTNRPYRVARR